MIEAGEFLDAAAARGLDFYSGVPCSYLTPLIDAAIASPRLRYVGAANEGEAVAVAAGARLGGRGGVVLLQNSGLGNAVSPLTSLAWTFKLPVLLIPTLRGEPGGAPDEPQHELMGSITLDLLERMQIAWQTFPAAPGDVAPALARAAEHMRGTGLCYALVVRRGALAGSGASAAAALPRRPVAPPPSEPDAAPEVTRVEVLRAIREAAGASTVLIATTGYTGRELYALGDRGNQLYMVGSMGCASSFALGLALARPDLRIVVVDGDGAALMRLGALPTIGRERPGNLIHLVLDNGRHESTGGQATAASSLSFPGLAAASGYPRVRSLAAPEQVAAELARASGELTFLHVPIRPGVLDGLPRPALGPAEVARRLERFIARP